MARFRLAKVRSLLCCWIELRSSRRDAVLEGTEVVLLLGKKCKERGGVSFIFFIAKGEYWTLIMSSLTSFPLIFTLHPCPNRLPDALSVSIRWVGLDRTSVFCWHYPTIQPIVLWCNDHAFVFFLYPLYTYSSLPLVLQDLRRGLDQAVANSKMS